MPRAGEIELLVGSFTSDRGGDGVGIVSVGFDPRTGLLGTPQVVADAGIAPSPSFLAVHPTRRVVYAVAAGRAELRVLRRAAGGRSLALESVHRVGPGPCHVSVGSEGRSVFVSCYGDGSVHAFRIADDGRVCARMPPAPGERPGVSHAHCALPLPDGTIVSTDLGSDQVRFWQPTAVGLSLLQSVELRRGTGPRHIAVHPAGTLLVLTEPAATLLAFGQARSGRWELARSIPLVHDAEHGAGAEISLDAAGRRAYLSIRGVDRLLALRVSDDGLSATPIVDVDAGGVGPRHHLVVDDLAVVANEKSGAVVSIDVRTGRPTDRQILSAIAVGSPTCIVRF